MNFYELAQARYSCRKYSNQLIAEETLKELLSVIQLCPTAHNSQAQHVYVVESEEAKSKLEEAFHFRFGSPLYLIIAIREDKVWVNAGNRSNTQIDGSIVTTHLMLQAHDLGLETCWIGQYDPDVVKKNLLPANETAVAILTVGYPAETGGGPSSRHTAREEAESYYTRLR